MTILTHDHGGFARNRMAEADQLLREKFRLDSWRVGQREVVQSLLDGRNAAAIFPTGGGKSLCYQLPALLLDGLTVVVSPLLALMKDQVESLARRGIHAVRLDSSLSPEELRSATKSLRQQEAKILFVAPERFFNERFRQSLTGLSIALFAIDEAHCISQWGHQFRPDYLKLSKVASELKVERILALTATATPEVVVDIQREFQVLADDVQQTPFYRPNLHLRFSLCTQKERIHQLLQRLKSRPPGPTIVYVALQSTAEQVAEALQMAGCQARAYHAGMEDDVRREVQDWFMESMDGIVVATIAFGMGVDKSNIRYVYHFHLAKSLENYAQEVGRAGRDGGDALCETLLVPEDRILLDNFTHGDIPTTEGLEQWAELIAHQHETFFISYFSLAKQCDIRDLVVRTLMTYLELDGFLESIGPRYDTYQFKPKLTSQELLSRLDPERRSFAASVLAMSVKKKYWFDIDITVATKQLACERERIVRMLEYFSEQSWIELQTSGLVHGYRKKSSMADWKGIAGRYDQRLRQREASDLERVDQVIALAKSQTCQAALLSKHFGQTLEISCGRCSRCCGQGIDEIPMPIQGSIGDSAWSAVQRLAKSHPDALGSPRQKAKFLVGLSSPRFTSSRLSRDPAFGSCSEVPFAVVLESMSHSQT